MRITGVTRGSIADRAGIRAGDELLALDDRRLDDAIDLRFALAWADGAEAVYGLTRDGAPFGVTLPLGDPGELGFEVEEAPVRTCGNRCIFCFVDQLPRGLRSSLYVKDEDYRLSFSYGNYITLTNLSDGDYERIAEQRLSPLYVSVHATDDAVRRAMLGNSAAPPVVECLRRLGDSGIRVHAQAVLCPGVNDGEVLERTIDDLFALGHTVQSIAVVPVGLTAHRTRLPALRAVSGADAAAVLDALRRWQERFLRSGRERTVYAADELYLLAGRPLPTCDEYDDFPQIENGVGLLRSFESELSERAGMMGDSVEPPLTVTLLTGRLAGAFLAEALGNALAHVDGLTVRVATCDNHLLGPSVTVAGLIPGADMIDALRKSPASGAFLLPGEAFNEDGVTLDGMNEREIAEAAGRRNVVATDDIIGTLLELTGGPEPGVAADESPGRGEREEEGR